MSGTKAGAKKSVEKIKALYGENFFKSIGQKGGVTSYLKDPVTGKALKGFALNNERAREAGRLGGANSRRGPRKLKEVMCPCGNAMIPNCVFCVVLHDANNPNKHSHSHRHPEGVLECRDTLET